MFQMSNNETAIEILSFTILHYDIVILFSSDQYCKRNKQTTKISFDITLPIWFKFN